MRSTKTYHKGCAPTVRSSAFCNRLLPILHAYGIVDSTVAKQPLSGAFCHSIITSQKQTIASRNNDGYLIAGVIGTQVL